MGWMNESAVRLEEQIISLFSEWETELNYLETAICGPKKKVNKLTGSMALLR